MAGGTKFQRSSNKFNGLMQVIHIRPLLKSALKAVSKVIERSRPVGMTRGAKHQRSSIELNGLI
jgi:hypothetical protein